MADKYPNVTPYLYCGGNPIMMVDPDGREKKILVASGALLETAEDEPDPPTALVIFAHGSSMSIGDEVNRGDGSWEGGPFKVAKLISKQSKTFNNDHIKNKLIILSCCKTGAKPTKKYKMNFAQLLSLQLFGKLVDRKKNGQNVYVCAPTANIIAGSRKFFGLVRAKAKGTEENMPWVIYKNGKEIDRFWIKGKNPTEEVIRKCIQRYEEQ